MNIEDVVILLCVLIVGSLLFGLGFSEYQEKVLIKECIKIHSVTECMLITK